MVHSNTRRTALGLLLFVTACGSDGGSGSAGTGGGGGAATGTGTSSTASTSSLATGSTSSGTSSESSASASPTSSASSASSGTSTSSSADGGAGGAGSSTGSVATGGAPSTTSSSSSTGTGGELAQFCAGEGPTVELPIFGDCTGDLAKKTFLFSVCGCSGLEFNNTVSTTSFDSSVDSTKELEGGSVGVNGSIQYSSPMKIGGTFWVEKNINGFNTLDVKQDLRTETFTNSLTMHVENDVYVEGKAQNNNTLAFDFKNGAKYHYTSAANLPSNLNASAAQLSLEPNLTIPPPCDCKDPVDISAIVASFATKNDNGSILTPTTFVQNQLPIDLDLPCGRYYLAQWSSLKPVTVRVKGRVAIFVDGGFQNAEGVQFDLSDPDAELDLFVDGDITANNVLSLGDTTRPAASRLYVNGNVTFANETTLVANVFAPKHTFRANNVLHLYGSVIADKVVFASPTDVHYDEAILKVDGCGDGKPPTGGNCASCGDCANPTPKCNPGTGQCEACQADADCCPPLQCQSGTCGLKPPG